MVPRSNVFLPETFVLDKVQVVRLVSWAHVCPLVKSFHDEDHRPFLKLCRDFRLEQWTGFALPVLEQVENTPSMVLESETELRE